MRAFKIYAYVLHKKKCDVIQEGSSCFSRMSIIKRKEDSFSIPLDA